MKLLSGESVNILDKTVSISMSIRELILTWSAIGGLNEEELIKGLIESKGGTIPDGILTSLIEDKGTWMENGGLFDDLEEILSDLLNG